MPIIPVTALYIDPAATTVIITSISGIVIAVGVLGTHGIKPG